VAWRGGILKELQPPVRIKKKAVAKKEPPTHEQIDEGGSSSKAAAGPSSASCVGELIVPALFLWWSDSCVSKSW